MFIVVLLQLSFYTISSNKNVSATEREEIVHTVHPKPGRMVLWPSCVIQSSHPPSVNYFANLLMLRLVLKAKNDKQGTHMVIICLNIVIRMNRPS